MQALQFRQGRAIDFPPTVRHTIGWMQQSFRQWYADHPPPMPDRHARREFGYIPWPQYPGHQAFVRHLSFATAEQLKGYLIKHAPHSVYYSTSYYMRPGAVSMETKNWWRSEFLFDLDCDHLPEVRAEPTMPIEQQLRIVKQQLKRLLDEFLFGDLGLEPKDLWTSFSGGRGYHVHITNETWMQFGARERREIVDYVTGKVPTKRGSTEPDMTPYLWERVAHIDGKGHIHLATHIPDGEEPGWPGRITRTLVDLLEKNVLEAERTKARAWVMEQTGLEGEDASRFVLTFKRSTLERIAHGNIEQGRLTKHVIQRLLATAVLPAARAETDEPVSADLKRVVRLPGSLHGKTGLQCQTFPVGILDEYDPLRDAIAFDLAPVQVLPRVDAQVELAGERVSVKAGVQVPIPRAHAMFLCGQQKATVIQ